ncbi:MAG: ABC transporter substrate-binding protein [Bryobacteraceae bacterium]|jgi:NitT/TauT family transport system substrate-binding protein
MARLKMYRFVLALTTVALVGRALSGAEASAPQVRVAVSSDAITLLPVHLAQTLGFYQQEGLAVTLTPIASASKTLDALHDGSVNVALGTTVPIQTAAEGRAVQGFLVIYSRINTILVVSPAASARVHGMADLKGRRIGVSNLGSGSQIFLNYLLAVNGLRPADVNAVAIGVGAPSAAAMEKGEVDAAIVVGGAINSLLRAHPGLTILADTRTPEGSERVFGPASYPGSLLVAEESWLKANPDTARRFVRAVKHGMQWMGEHSAEKVRANMREDQRMADADADLATIRDFQHMLSPDGAIQAGSPEIMYKVLATSLENVRTAHIDLRRAYTNEYLTGK